MLSGDERKALTIASQVKEAVLAKLAGSDGKGGSRVRVAGEGLQYSQVHGARASYSELRVGIARRG